MMRRQSKTIIFLIALLWAFSYACAGAEIGVLTEVEGDVQLIRATGVFAAAEGVSLQSEDVIKTGESAAAQLEMIDGSVLQLGSQSELYLAEYQFSETATVTKAEVGILTGWLRFLTGRLSRDVQYEYVTPTVTIGIRGTEGIISAAEQETELLLNEGRVDVAELDSEGRSGAVTSLRAGEYFSRRQGQRARRSQQASAGFKNREPTRFRRQVERRLMHLQGRRAAPRKLREADYQDVERLLRSNPRLRQKLMRRFEKRLQDPEFRAKAKKRLKNHPEWRGELQKPAPARGSPLPERPTRGPRPIKKEKSKDRSR